MGVEKFFNKTVVLKRKASGTGNAVESWVNISTALRCCIYPISPNDALAFKSSDFRANITHRMNCLINADVKIDDKLVSGSEEYLIKIVNSWDKFYQIYLSKVK